MAEYVSVFLFQKTRDRKIFGKTIEIYFSKFCIQYQLHCVFSETILLVKKCTSYLNHIAFLSLR